MYQFSVTCLLGPLSRIKLRIITKINFFLPRKIHGFASPRLTHEITVVRGQGRGGVYAEDRSIRVLGVDMPSEYLLPRRDEYTRVYTTVYPRVHNSIHACTQVRSKYILCRARLYTYFLGIMPRIFSDGLRLSGI